MKKRMLGAGVLSVMAALGVSAATVPESARELPRLADVDVVVVGGTVAGVQAAAAAKAAGASVFLVAPRFQLGEEIVTTRALWLDNRDEGVDDPVVADLFLSDRATRYTYKYDKKPNSSHADNELTRLRDGVASSSANESVQFDADVAVTADLGASAGKFLSLRLAAYRRTASGGFVTGGVTVESSADGTAWAALPGSVALANEPIAGESDTLDVFTFTPSQEVAPAYLRVTCARAQGYSRQLLAELTIVTENATSAPARPLCVAQALDRILLDAEVPFLTGSPVTDVLRDGAGRVAGVAVANRNGRQAIQAKVVIDATEWAAAARAAGVPFVSGAETTRFTRTVICKRGTLGELAAQEGWQVLERSVPRPRITVMPEDLRGTDAEASFETGAYVVSREFPFANLTYAGWLAIERQMRDATWTKSISDVSEKCAFTPPDHITGTAEGAAWPGADNLSLDALRPAGVAGLYVLGPCADLPRADAGRLQLAGVETLLGRRVGAAAATEAKAATLSGAVGLGAAPSAGAGQVRERLSRPLNVGTEDGATIASAGADLPVLAEVDVLVVGGGTAGVPATLAAAGEGRSVLVADVLYELGGVPVDNRIGRFYHGNRRGFAMKQLDQVKDHGWVFHAACADWQRRACGAAGAAVWLGAFAEGVVTEGGDDAGRARVTGVVFALPDGTRGVVRAKATIDATGNGDLTAAAGGETTFLDEPEFAGQGAAAANIQLGNSYLNTDVGFLDDTDAGDLSHFMLRSRLALTASWMQPAFPSTGSRERRRIVGDATVTELDVLRGRTWPDTIMHGLSNFDMHGFSTSPLLMLRVHPAGDLAVDLPFRALLPRGLEGLLATGLGVSATRDAMPIIRMQPDVQNQGWAAGLAAAAACGNGGTLRAIDVKALQRALVEADILDARVVEDVDGGAVSETELDDAIAKLTTDYKGLESILAADREVALAKLRAAYAAAATSAITRQVALGMTLALLGDATAVEFLVDRYAALSWDNGFDFQGLDNYGRKTSTLDGALYALAQTRDPRILGWMGALGAALADSPDAVRLLSHFRMFNLAVRAYPAAALAAPVLAAVERGRETLLGNAFAEARPTSYSTRTADAERSRAITELALAETLLRLGDPDGSGRESLQAFAADPRASYAAWARRLLATDIPAPQTDVDGVWTASTAAGDWAEAANWRDGRLPNGPTATATFEDLADGAGQTVRLPDEGIEIGSLAFTDAALRTFTGGPLTLLSPSAFLDVAGGAVTFQNALNATRVEKTGAGTTTFAGPLQLDNRLTVAEGTVRLETDAIARAVAGDTFTLGADEDVWLTHIGCRADEVEALAAENGRLRILFVNVDGVKIEAVLFTARHRGFEQGGYRYLRIGNPRRLVPGATYTLQTSTAGHHPGALLAGRMPEQSMRRATVDGRLELAAPFASVGTLSGSGVVAADSPSPVNLTLTGVAEEVFDGTLDATGAPLSLTKTGSSTATLNGARGIRDGISPRDGILVLDTPDALDPEATIVFGTRDSSTGSQGRLAFAAADAVVSNPVACVKMFSYNCLNNGFVAFPGHRLTLRDTEVTTPDSTCTDGGKDGTLALIATYSSTDAAVVTAENVEFPYIDLTAQVYGEEKNPRRGANAVVLRGVTSDETGLRKLTALNTVSNSVGGTLTVAESAFSVNWLDFSGPYVGFNLTTGSTLVASTIRFPNNNGVQHSNADILIDGGARLVANGIPTQDGGWYTTNTVLRFDDAILQLKSGSAPSFMPLEAANPPAEILPGGLTLDLSAYDIAKKGEDSFRTLCISHAMTSPVAGVPGPLTILGGEVTSEATGGECKLAAAMSFNGPTTVRGGTLICDFAAAPGLETMLAPGTDLVLDGGAFLLQGSSGKRQSFAMITNAAATPAPLTIASGCRVETSALVGAGGFAVKGGTLALDLPLSESLCLGGSLVLDGTTLVLATQQTEIAPEQIPGGSFEPSPEQFPEPEGDNKGSLDKRGKGGANWLKANVADWTFEWDDNVGVTRNGGYFTTSDVTNGVACAFLRNTSGRISRTFTVERAARYTLVFDWRSRYYDGTLYTAQIQVMCDGEVVHTTESLKTTSWTETTVDLGLLAPGEHVFSFGSIVPGGDALVDSVRLGYVTKPTQADLEKMVSPDLTLDLRNGAKLALDFEGRLPVAEVRIDGTKRYGVLSAETMPASFSGTGSIYCKPRGMVIIYR